MNANTVALEKALIRRLTDGPTDREDVQLAAFWTISKWPKASNCLLAVEAMISNRINRKSPQCDKAFQWIMHQEDKRLIYAVILRESARPILEAESFAYANIAAIPNLFAWPIWDKISNHQSVSWKEILEATGVSKYDPYPREADRIDDCRRLMADFPSEARASVAADHFGAWLKSMPGLVALIVDNLPVWPNADQLIAQIDKHFAYFAKDLVRLLVNPDIPIPYIKCGIVNRYEQMFDLAQMCAKRLRELEEKDREELADQLTNSENCCWLYPQADKIYQIAGSPSYHLICDQWYSPPIAKKLDDVDVKDLLVNYVNKKLDGKIPEDIVDIASLPAETAAKLYLNSASFAAKFEAVIKRGPEIFTAALVGPISEGKVKERQLETYLNIVGVNDDNLEPFRAWLLSAKENYFFSSSSYDYSEMLTKHIIPHNLPAQLLLARWDIEKILDSGYQLKAEDLTKGTVRRILPNCENLHNPFFALSTKVLANQQWREILLTSNTELDYIVKIIFDMSGTMYEKGPAWLEEILPDDLTAEYPKIREAIVRLAISCKKLSFSGYQKTSNFLLIGDRRQWVDLYSAETIEYIYENWQTLFSLDNDAADWLIPKGKQYDLYFGEISDSKSLYGVSWGKHLFTTVEGKSRLASWLLRHMDIFRDKMENWLERVEYYKLATSRLKESPAIRTHINALIDHDNPEVRALAIKIRSTYR